MRIRAAGLAICWLVFAFSPGSATEERLAHGIRVRALQVSTTTAPPPTLGEVLSGPVSSFLANRSGTTSVAVFDSLSGQSWSYSDEQFIMASTSKLVVASLLVLNAQTNGTEIPEWKRELLKDMITWSSNSAAAALWRSEGRYVPAQHYVDSLGVTNTQINTVGFFGLSLTTAADEVLVMKQFAYPSETLSDESRAFVNQYLGSVAPEQRWGATGGVSAEARVWNKNGWIVRTGGAVTHSVAHISDSTHDYVIALLSKDNPSHAYGVDTIETVSGLVWNATGHN